MMQKPKRAQLGFHKLDFSAGIWKNHLLVYKQNQCGSFVQVGFAVSGHNSEVTENICGNPHCSFYNYFFDCKVTLS